MAARRLRQSTLRRRAPRRLQDGRGGATRKASRKRWERTPRTPGLGSHCGACDLLRLPRPSRPSEWEHTGWGGPASLARPAAWCRGERKELRPGPPALAVRAHQSQPRLCQPRFLSLTSGDHNRRLQAVRDIPAWHPRVLASRPSGSGTAPGQALGSLGLGPATPGLSLAANPSP